MELYKETKIKGSFKGWNSNQVFEFINGDIWMQSKYKYHYHYAYRPEAKIFRDGSYYYLQVDGMDEMVQIRKISRDKFESLKKENEV